MDLRRLSPSRWPDAAIDGALVVLAAALLVLEVRQLLDVPPWRFDVSAFERPDAVATLLYGCVLAPLLVRRRAPLLAAGLVLLVSYTYQALGYVALATFDLAALVALYSAGVYGRSIPSAAGLVLVGLWLLAIHATRPVPLEAASLVLLYVTFAGAWVLGRQVRRQREQAAALAERNALLERQRDLEARQAASAERARVARELHDVIAHGLSVVVVQAEALQLAMTDAGAEAQRALQSIRTASRGALAETRRVLGLMRAETAGAETANGASPPGEPAGPSLGPQPGLAQLDDLVEQFREAGLAVELSLPARAPALDRGTDISAYRLVQEALTNTLKHAHARRAWVVVRADGGALELVVRDDGRAAASAGGHGGHGQDGMRERVAMLGGRLEMGPCAGGGYLVRALVPVQEAP